MKFLVNPKQKRRRMATKRKRGKATPAQRRALKKARAALKRKRNASKRRTAPRRKVVRKRTVARKNPVRRRKTSIKRRRSTVAKRRTKKRTTARRNPRRKRIKGVRRVRRQVFTRNPPLTMKNVVKVLQQGAIDATGVTVGKIGARFVSGFIPSFGEGPIMNVAKQAIAALAVGFIGGQIVPREYARFLMAGALAAPVETFLQTLPVVGDLVSGNAELGEYMGYGLPMGEGADIALPMGEYVQPEVQPLGEYVEMYP